MIKSIRIIFFFCSWLFFSTLLTTWGFGFTQGVAIRTISWQPAGDLIAIGLENGDIQVWNAHGQPELVLKDHMGVVTDIQWSLDGSMFASASQDATVRVWRSDGFLITLLVGHKSGATGMAWRNDNILTTTADDGVIRFWSPEGNLIQEIESALYIVHSVIWSSDGQLLAAMSDSEVSVWNKEGKFIKHISLQKDVYKYPVSIKWSPNNDRLLVTYPRSIAIWNANDDTMITYIDQYTSDVDIFKENPIWNSNESIIILGDDGRAISAAQIKYESKPSIELRELNSNPELYRLEMANNYQLAIGVPKGYGISHALILSPGESEYILLDGDTGPITQAKWSYDGYYIALSTVDGQVTLWSQKGTIIRKIIPMNTKDIRLYRSITIFWYKIPFIIQLTIIFVSFTGIITSIIIRFRK